MFFSLPIYLTGLVTPLRVACRTGFHFLSRVMLLMLSSSGWSILSTGLCNMGRRLSRTRLKTILKFSRVCLHMFQVQNRAEGPKFRLQLQSFMPCIPSDQQLTKGILIQLMTSISCQEMFPPPSLYS